MENFIAVTGIIAKTPETKTSQKGASYTRARFVHDQGSYDKNTQTWTPAKTPAAWYTLYATASVGPRLAAMSKGDKALVTGRIDVDEWTDKNGGQRTELIIHVRSIARIPQANSGPQAQAMPATPVMAAPVPAADPWETYNEPEF